ncbi:hypothetical protein J113_16735 [Mycobacterium tuberculosis CAS/NITR204]|nr:hypothetical protein J113_16735 [Mycobacterium tuberculosis CAS/NITR204]
MQRFAENLVFTEAPKLVRHLQNTQETLRTIRQAVKITANIMTTAVPSPPAEIAAGRPVTSTSCPTAARARRLVYAPDLDGRADPGEIVWTWVAYEQDPTRGKDRPVLVVGRDRSVLLGLLVSSQERHAADRDWVGIGSGAWDYEGRESWVRLDRVLDVPEESIRREGAILEREVFDVVAARLRADYAWRKPGRAASAIGWATSPDQAPISPAWRRRGPPSGPLRSRAVSPARRRCGPPSGPLRSRAISPE